MSLPTHLESNVERFSGFADRYDAFRPQPPIALVDLLCDTAKLQRPRLVVDLGSGTGLATCLWAGRADHVIGVEPNRDMRAQAQVRTAAIVGGRQIAYIDAFAHATGLPDACADIVTCSQAMHWMEPVPTLGEIARILRPGGVLAVVDCDWPPTMNWEAEIAYERFVATATALCEDRGWSGGVARWAKEQHLERIRSSGLFRYAKEIVVHNREMGNAERLVGLALSQGGVAALLKHGLSEADFGLDRFRDDCRRLLGAEPAPWYFCYRVRLGIK